MLHPQARHAPLKARAIRGIAISEEVLRGRIPRKGLDELLGRPLGGRVCGHVEMNHFPPCVRKDDQHEEHLEPDRGDGEEIERDELRQVILQEGPPGGRGRLSRADAILLDRGFRHRNPELPQFAENPRGPPLRISRGDLPDQCPDFLADRWSARVPPAEAGPVVPKTLALHPASPSQSARGDADPRATAHSLAPAGGRARITKSHSRLSIPGYLKNWGAASSAPPEKHVVEY